jgi:adenylate cyclase
MFTAILLAHVAGKITIPYVNDMENLLYDTRIRLSAPGGIDERIVIIAIDEASLDSQGHWPWTRDKLARLVEQLFEYGVSVVGFDVVFAERDESADVRLLQEMASGDEDAAFRNRLSELEPRLDRDILFAQALGIRPTVLGYYFDTNTKKAFETGELPLSAFDFHESMANSIYLPMAEGYAANLEVLMATAYSAGFLNNPLIDHDGVVRRAPLLHEFRLGAYESFSLAMAATILNDISLPIFVDSSAVEAGYPPLETIELAGRSIPIDAQGAVLVPYRGGAGSFPYVPAHKVIEGTVEKPHVLNNVIAIVGATAPGMQDLRSTPFGSIYPGVEIHANVLAGIMDGNFRWKPAYTLAAEMITVAVFGLISSLALPLLSPLVALFTASLMAILALTVNFYMWETQQIVLPLAVTLYSLMGIFMLNMVFGYFFESRSRSHMDDLFGQYVPPDLVREMSEDPRGYSLASRKLELTVLFSDIRSFTSISENLDAEELSELINLYLTPMTRIIHEYNGTIDKYIGDAIMAFWGAPIHSPDHATQAVAAALAMLDSLVELNEDFEQRGWPEIHIGIGINTGPMSVGNMGSQFRRAYTVMGDAVNLGSRLEGLTKAYGATLIVSEETAREAPDYLYQEVDLVRVKGKAEPVVILEAIGLKDEVPAERAAEVADFKEALMAYRRQDWDGAETILKQLLARKPGLKLYSLYLDRIAQFRAEPPGPDWDGVFTHETK